MIVKYSKKFTTGPWLNEDIGFEIELEDTEGKPLPEAIQVTLGFLKEMAEKFHKDNNPQLNDTDSDLSFNKMYEVNGKTAYLATPPNTVTIPTIDPKKKDDTEIAIDNATSKEELTKIKDDVFKYGLSEQYLSKLKSFQ